MTERKDVKFALDGYSKSKPLTEGYIRKGGSNNATSQIQTRPPAPAPMKPAATPNQTASPPAQSGRWEFQKYCSKKCQRSDSKEKYLQGLYKPRKCRTCAVTYEKRQGRRMGFYCSDRCQKAFKRSLGVARSALIRATNKHMRIDFIDQEIVFRIQQWRCQMCGFKCDSSKSGTNHPLAPTLDHIISVTKGGEHTWDNVQTLCRKCNTIKSAGVMKVTPPLLGVDAQGKRRKTEENARKKAQTDLFETDRR